MLWSVNLKGEIFSDTVLSDSHYFGARPRLRYTKYYLGWSSCYMLDLRISPRMSRFKGGSQPLSSSCMNLLRTILLADGRPKEKDKYFEILGVKSKMTSFVTAADNVDIELEKGRVAIHHHHLWQLSTVYIKDVRGTDKGACNTNNEV
ncbi:hypothetical protein RRG08_013049 [Elysia crispata]|uniref:Uncharacterized protein n=1 Tax=Elysia crispata TaxID=231223 RepID=A0AAE0ZZX0_9GAST|nr:hypothetical protein RRG08_013049 [Elysia crispata]